MRRIPATGPPSRGGACAGMTITKKGLKGQYYGKKNKKIKIKNQKSGG